MRFSILTLAVFLGLGLARVQGTVTLAMYALITSSSYLLEQSGDDWLASMKNRIAQARKSAVASSLQTARSTRHDMFILIQLVNQSHATRNCDI
jgi:hypothetical protein